MNSRPNQRVMLVSSIDSRILFLGILFLTSLGCNSHTPFSSGGPMSQNVPDINDNLKPKPFAPPLLVTQFEEKKKPNTKIANIKTISPAPSSSRNTLAPTTTRRFATGLSEAHSERLLTFPYINSGEKIPVIFPGSKQKGAVILKRTNNLLSFETGAHQGVSFEIPTQTEGTVTCNSVDRSDDTLEIENQTAKQGNQILKIIHGRYNKKFQKPEDFFILLSNGENLAKLILPLSQVLWSEFVNTRWSGAFLFSPRFENFSTPYSTATVTFSAKADERFFNLQRTPQGGPWATLAIGTATDLISKKEGATGNGKTVSLFPVKLKNVPLLIGTIRETTGEETWFAAFSRDVSSGQQPSS